MNLKFISTYIEHMSFSENPPKHEQILLKSKVQCSATHEVIMSLYGDPLRSGPVQTLSWFGLQMAEQSYLPNPSYSRISECLIHHHSLGDLKTMTCKVLNYFMPCQINELQFRKMMQLLI